jgi:hypothetical protein
MFGGPSMVGVAPTRVLSGGAGGLMPEPRADDGQLNSSVTVFVSRGRYRERSWPLISHPWHHRLAAAVGPSPRLP